MLLLVALQRRALTDRLLTDMPQKYQKNNDSMGKCALCLRHSRLLVLTVDGGGLPRAALAAR